MHHHISLKVKIFTFTMISYPILILYSINIGSVSLADLILIIQFPVLLYEIFLNNKKPISFFISIPFVVYIAYIIIQLFFVILIHNSMNNIIFRTLRYVFFLFTVCFLSKKYFNFEYGIKVYKYITLFSVCFIIFQMIIFFTTRKYIQGYIPFLPLVRTGLADFSNKLEKKLLKNINA
jgi:hypothetical protein